MKNFPTLYQRTATGAIQSWDIQGGEDVREPGVGVICTQWGQVGGAQQTTTDVRREGKNTGKANATTAVQQAEKEAEAKWKKKQAREGYVPDLERAQAGGTDRQGVFPMYAHPIDKINKKYFSWPADLQRKYNGVRIMSVVEDGVCSLFSKKGLNVTVALPHVKAAYEGLFPGLGRHVFDGEAYRHGWTVHVIGGFTKVKAPKDGHEEISHVVYDMPSAPGSWLERRRALEATLPFRPGAVEPAQTFTVTSLDEAWKKSKKFLDEGYEGGILRQLDGVYEHDKRSHKLAKLKFWKDAEFKIVGVGEGRGKFAGKAVFQCVTDAGVGFEASAPGDMEEKARWFREAAEVVGKMLTLRYAELTPDGAPFHGVGIAVRDYE